MNPADLSESVTLTQNPTGLEIALSVQHGLNSFAGKPAL
jgi:hypothetical protein